MNEEKRVLTKKEVNRSWFIWIMFAQACYNYENMQGLAFLHSMCPAIAKLYPNDKEKRREAMERHNRFFNSEPHLGSSIVGLSLAMEEQKALGAEIDDDAIISIKTGLMGPMSGIGDTIFQGVLTPLIIAFAIDWAMGGSIAVPIIFFIIMTAISLVISKIIFTIGYEKGSSAILDMLENGTINKIVSISGILGCMVIGGMVSNFVVMNCGIEIVQSADSVFSIQGQLFDAILPGLLPLLLTLACYKLLKSGKSSILVMLLIVAVGIIGGLTGILA